MLSEIALIWRSATGNCDIVTLYEAPPIGVGPELNNVNTSSIQVFSPLFHICLLPIKCDSKSFMNQNQTCPCSNGSWL